MDQHLSREYYVQLGRNCLADCGRDLKDPQEIADSILAQMINVTTSQEELVGRLYWLFWFMESRMN